MPDFLSIPGNIRQQYMPFTIAGPGMRQVFSFKDVKAKKYPQPCAQIHPFSRWVETLIDNDSSIQYTHGPDGSKKVTLSQFLDEIPSLQIREYVPDAKLTQTFKWFSYFKKGFDAGLQNIDNKAFTFSGMKTEIAKVMKDIGEKMKQLTSGDAPLLAKVVGGLTHYYQDKGYNIGADNGFAVLFLPFIMYYRLTTTHTNNVYEIPYSMQNEIMKSDGTYGWTSTQSDFGVLDSIPQKVGENPIAKMLLGNTIKVNMMPSFQPTGEARGESFTINIDLINDSDEAAINNFLMCHTLFGNNRWLQYGFVQAGASLYDVKLPGANRYFMCTGAFSCKGKGAFRTPSDVVCNAILSHNKPSKTFSGFLKSPEGKTIRNSMVTSKATQIANKAAEEGSSAVNNQAETTSLAFNRRDVSLPSVAQRNFAMVSELAANTYNAAKKTAVINTAKDWANAIANKAAGKTSVSLPTAKKMETLKRQNSELVEAQKKLDSAIDATEKAKNLIPDAEKKLETAVEKVCETKEGQAYYVAYDKHKTALSDEVAAQIKYAEAASAKIEAVMEYEAALAEWEENPTQETEQRKRAAEDAMNIAIADEARAESDLTHATDVVIETKTTQDLLYGNLPENEKLLAKEMVGADEELGRAYDTAPGLIKAAEEAQAKAQETFDGKESAVNKTKDSVIEALRPEADAAIEAMYDEAASTVSIGDIKKLIKIPDVYSLTLTFNSLLPDNFNNYLYGFRAGNLDPIENYARGTVDETGAFEKLVQQLENAMKQEI